MGSADLQGPDVSLAVTHGQAEALAVTARRLAECQERCRRLERQRNAALAALVYTEAARLEQSPKAEAVIVSAAEELRWWLDATVDDATDRATARVVVAALILREAREVP